ncbi:MAG: orotidine-5'-phosphate decarboxylase [Candidatus Heimdallarchaeota archaeon]|nr:orotidine-5'-phosphate decarboxylase [Candidatus Heimdallarchaeota archaeon]
MKVNLSFNERVNWLISKKASFLCVGLDPDMDKIPPYLKYEKNPIDLFIREIVEATKDSVVAYKANLAFYECEGQNGLEALQNLSSIIPKDVILILDGKRGDIDNTAKKYAKSYFETLGADAVTLNPYMGQDSLQPFFTDPEKGSFVLALTSNRGSSDFQHLQIGTEPLHQYVAKKIREWNKNKNCGLVVGATDIEELKILRRVIPDMPFLVPGIGAQGGNLKEVLEFGRDKDGLGILINVGRDILYQSSGKDFAQKSKQRVIDYVNEMSSLIRTGWNYL